MNEVLEGLDKLNLRQLQAIEVYLRLLIARRWQEGGGSLKNKSDR